MTQIKIMGAGPTGMTAAIILARAGKPVVVYERAGDVGTRHDGDYEGLENWTTDADVWSELADWGIEKNFRSVPICAGTFFGPGFRQAVPFEDDEPLFYFTRRGPMPGSIDRGLLEQARDLGVQVEFDRPAEPEQVNIIASGFPRARAFAVGYNFKTRAPNGAFVCLDNDLTPQAYAYLVFCEGEGTIAATAFTPQPRMKEALPRVIEGFHSRVQFDMQEPRYFAASIGFGLPETAQKDGRLHVGEAGGFQDVIAGFGLRIGMTSAYLAAQSLLYGVDYDQLWRPRLLPLLQAAAVTRWLLEIGHNPGYTAVLYYMRASPQARAFLRRHYLPLPLLTRLLLPLGRRTVNSKAKMNRN